VVTNIDIDIDIDIEHFDIDPPLVTLQINRNCSQ